MGLSKAQLYGTLTPEQEKWMREQRRKAKNAKLACAVCGSTNLIFESAAEGYSCPRCGSSDSDE